MGKKKINFFIISLIFVSVIYGQNSLMIRPSDLKVVRQIDESSKTTVGYHLYVKKSPQIESIILTETTKDLQGKEANYAYRAMEYNNINGDEIRFLDGKKLESKYALYSLVDSTSENIEGFGEAFHIYIPSKIQYGYPWTRNGTVEIGKGTFVNIRAFSKKYADYTGSFFDNPYMFDFEKRPIPTHTDSVREEIKDEKVELLEETEPIVLTDAYNPEAGEKFGEISDFLIFSKGPETIVDDIMQSIKSIPSKKSADIVFAIDATGSMKDDIEKLRKDWIPNLIAGLKEFGDCRLGLILYRDYGDNFRYKGIPVRFFDFTEDIDIFIKNLNSFEIRGREGGDIPEAVYEALYGAFEFYNWRGDASRKIILVGDAQPHPTPRGTKKYTKELVQKLAAEKSIAIDAIITPDDKSKRGR